MNQKFRFVILFILLVLFFSACKKNVEEKPNVVWINCEDISPNLGCYGDDFATTPNIDKIANSGIVFNKAFATAPVCSPARSCLITGLYATSMGTQHLRCEIPRTEAIKTLPEILSANGYFTTNQAKTDYNFNDDGIWDYWKNELAPWRRRKNKEPFFSMFVFGMTHEGSVNNSAKWAQNTADLPKELFHDSTKVPIPPYYPDTPEIRKIWTHYYDNITVFDRKVGEIMKNLEEDGLLENTIVFIFSDHGAGLPRYKRWLNVTGLQVPLVVHIPDKYKNMSRVEPGTKNNELVSFVDFAPSVLSIAGVDIPETMEGQPFLGKRIAPPRSHVIGARSRADNMYEMSRAVITDNWIFVRHYYPHYKYIQPGIIFGDQKESIKELRRLKKEGQLNKEALKMWGTKPTEELYNLKLDPQELNNRALEPTNKMLTDSLRELLHDWALKYPDTGLFAEAEYMMRSKFSTPYEWINSGRVDLREVLNAAEMVGKAGLRETVAKLKYPEAGVRYWAVINLQAMGEKARPAFPELVSMLKDESAAVQVAAAETLCKLGIKEPAMTVLGGWILNDNPQISLQATRAAELLGKDAAPLIRPLFKVVELNSSKDPKATRRFKDFNFAAFTTWSAEGALYNIGATEKPVM